MDKVFSAVPACAGYNWRIYGGAVLRMGALVAWGLCAAVSGCSASGGSVTLFQPHLSGRQQEVRLTSEQAWWASDGDGDRVLVEFPLPGATTGRPMYLLYLRLDEPPAAQDGPAGAQEEAAGTETESPPTPGDVPVSQGDAPAVEERPDQNVRGFLIQTRGRYAGRAIVTGGTARFQHPPRPGVSRRLDLDLTLEDGSRTAGSLMIRWDDLRLTYFETHQHAGDVAAVAATPQSAEVGSP
jgi:hypothetical protein